MTMPAKPEQRRVGGSRRASRLWALVLFATGAAACESSTLGPDASVQPFVGTWDAVDFRVTSDADPTVVFDVLAVGDFYISIEPSGQYTATLVLPIGPGVEIGQLSVIGSTVRLDPSFPATAPTATSTFSFVSATRLVLDGPTMFDFNADGSADEPAQAHIELQRR